MHNEIVTDPLESEDLWSDLQSNIELLNKLNVPQVQLFFGFSWGKDIYDKDWEELKVSTDSIEAAIKKAEESGFGKLADDNLYLTVPSFNTRVQYSHESDIHISFKDHNALVTAILDRWTAQKWLLVHQSKQKQLQRKK